MKPDRNHTTIFSNAEKEFWKQAFIMYVLVELAYMVVNYLTAWAVCSGCRTTVAFALSQLLLHILFTAFVWYVLQKFYNLPVTGLVLVNILLFAVYYFLWQGIYYGITHSGAAWLVGKGPAPRLFRQQVQLSWFEIGKYVLKVTAFYTLAFYYIYKKTERQRTQLAAINKDMQLNLLKQQLSPHFYFNTLNNLYGLARSNSNKLHPALQQLSEIMRYVLDDGSRQKVLLSQEINFLQSYIALEKLRYEQDTVIEMKVQGEINGQMILPMLLVQFVENAFKHGMKEKSEASWMNVKMDVKGQQLVFVVENSAVAGPVTEGIGINSVKNILNLQYNGKYDLDMQQQANRFSVVLKLNLV
jgi:sensor histidine kinase YesM